MASAVSGSPKTKVWPLGVAAYGGGPLAPGRVDNKLAETLDVQGELVGGRVDGLVDGLANAPGGDQDGLEDAPGGVQDESVGDHSVRAVLVARNTLFSVSST